MCTDPATTETYTLSLHDALPIFDGRRLEGKRATPGRRVIANGSHGQAAAAKLSLGAAIVHVHDDRSEEHTSELQSRVDLVCRLLLEKKKIHPQRLLNSQLSESCR